MYLAIGTSVLTFEMTVVLQIYEGRVVNGDRLIKMLKSYFTKTDFYEHLYNVIGNTSSKKQHQRKGSMNLQILRDLVDLFILLKIICTQ